METWLLLEFCNRGCISDAVEKGWFRQQQQGPGSGLQGALAGPGGAALQQQLAADSSLTSKSSSFSGGLVSAAPDLPAILATAREVAAAMSYLHHKGMLHGDLTGNNVLLTAAPAERRGYIAKVGGWGGGLLY
jgi:serine/threonine protein kinase